MRGRDSMEEKKPCPKCPECNGTMNWDPNLKICICEDCGAVFVPGRFEGVIVAGSIIGIHQKKPPP